MNEKFTIFAKKNEKMIVVTGAAGFIGSCMVQKLNSMGLSDIILVDDFTPEKKKRNWTDKQYTDKIDRNDFFKWGANEQQKIKAIIHLGARTDTTERDMGLLNHLNLEYSQQMWSFATQYGIPLLYASSAATYGNGEFGYGDNMEQFTKLQPLNPYGLSKQKFDEWVLKQHQTPPLWAGFKFFNVFGPNEYHKGRMASVVFHAFHQIQEKGEVHLFKSHKPEFLHGEQIRDFIYVKDVTHLLYWFLKNKPQSGIYNLGTGFGRTFNALVESIFAALQLETQINYIDIPEDIRSQYQYYTQAEMKKIRKVGYKKQFRPLERSVKEYVTQYLVKDKIL